MKKNKVFLATLLSAIFIFSSVQISLVFATDWTYNYQFNTNGYRWKARTWQWGFGWDGYKSPSDGEPLGEDFAHFEQISSDWVAHLQADHDGFGLVVCAGVTQGWAWPSPPPQGIYQPTPLDMEPTVTSLVLKTYLREYSGGPGSWEYAALADAWFKAYDVVYQEPGEPYEYFPQTVFGIDFYFAAGGWYPDDGSFLNNLPDGFSYVKHQMGTGTRTCNVRAALIEAAQNSPNFYIYFDPWNTVLWEVEDVVEENIGYITAKYNYLRMTYTRSSASAGMDLQILVPNDESWSNDGRLAVGTEEHFAIYPIKSSLKLFNGTYTVLFNGPEKTTYIDSIMLLAFNSTNMGYPVQLTKAFKDQRDVTTSLNSTDTIQEELSLGESLLLSFKPEKTQIDQQTYLLMIKCRQ